MNKPRKIAFFAPIKPPDHPIPSGDRLIAQNLVKAMKHGGNDVEIASRYICYSKRHNCEIFEQRRTGAMEEAERIVKSFETGNGDDLPDLWFTYHPYCKAPDWIGPKVSKKLGIPYVTAEAAKTGQGDETDPWKIWREESQTGIRAADLHFVLKPTDKAYLKELLGPKAPMAELAPFVDVETLVGTDQMAPPDHWAADTPILVTAGMMRKGKKDRNFYMLAELLTQVTDERWNLVVIGGGPEEAEIRSAFSSIDQGRIHWTGQVEHGDVLAWMRSADVFIWPGWREPIGMVYLEAQIQGLPVIAFESMGVPLVVRDGETGLLCGEGDLRAMKQNLCRLLEEPVLRNQMASNAPAYVKENHSLEAAAAQLNSGFARLF